MRRIDLNKERDKIQKHLLSLSMEDRYLRFFYVMKDEAITQYVNSLGDEDYVYAIGEDDIIALLHLSLLQDQSVELGISVLREHRGKKYAKHLVQFGVNFCKQKNVTKIFMSCLRENKAMQHIARSCGLRVTVDVDEAYAELQTNTTEMLGLDKSLIKGK